MTPSPAKLTVVLDDWALCIHENARDKGFWQEGIEKRNKAEMIALMHSELSEALEAIRKSKPDSHLPHLDPVGVELADCVIRILDYCHAFDIDLGHCIAEKVAYNQGRPHMHGGKAF